MTTLRRYANRLQEQYLIYRLNGSGMAASLVALFCVQLMWWLLPLEKLRYRRIRRRFRYYYPQITPGKPRLFDPLRFLVQSCYLMLVALPAPGNDRFREAAVARKTFTRFARLTAPLKRAVSNAASRVFSAAGEEFIIRSVWARIAAGILLLLAALLMILCITQPLELEYQFIFVALMWVLAMLLRSHRARSALFIMIFISFVVSSRYIWWRVSKTVLLEDPASALCSLALAAAEIYSYLVMALAYFQVCWVLDRKPAPLPEDRSLWPTVDVMIPSYNEPLEVVKPTLLAAIDLDWPRDKLHVYLLDDGTREEFRRYCESIGVTWISREKHNFAKAGNINHALGLTEGDHVAIFDCDHVPCRNFLTATVGWMMKDPRISLVQTPHHFYSDNPFEKNLGLHGRMPQEDTLFHRFIQKGNDTWNATMFCGSCAVIRRSALMEIGGIAVETVTEDAHTSLKLLRRGWSAAFIDIPLAAGISTESLAAHINQRIRWARGMVQIFRIDNPLFRKGLTMPQRLCFANASLHFLHGLPRIIFLIAPLPYLFCHIYVIFASGAAILAYVLPHMVHTTMTNHRMQENNRFYFWGAIYETILSWYITLPTLVALISPKHGKFNVTAKGESNRETHFDWTVSRPYLLLIFLNFAGLIYGAWNMLFDPFAEKLTIFINLLWVAYNLLVLGAASAVALETKQIRSFPRVDCRMRATLETAQGHLTEVTVTDFSQQAMGLQMPEPRSGVAWHQIFREGDPVFIILAQEREGASYRFSCRISRVAGSHLGITVLPRNLQENIAYIRCTFAEPNRWTEQPRNYDMNTLSHGIHTLVTLGFNGYLKMLRHSPRGFREILNVIVRIMIFVFSLLPHPVDLRRKPPEPARDPLVSAVKKGLKQEGREFP